ncbi:hypothetical protein [Butyrivibrio sp. AD3002]|uniref:hypothetical protein n=1 Tax=Butyrivibrio sp. AD3002 TaxID=1280670 RepID=UPI0003FDBA63|nr:hypothetical protein [Butyrivibrio sp. AD3002]
MRGEISRAAHASPDGITIKKSSTAAANFSPKPRDATLKKAGGMTPAFFSGMRYNYLKFKMNFINI